MLEVSNRFGSGTIYDEADLVGDVYIICTACISIWAEALSWATCHLDRVGARPWADSIIVLGCQVTDLAILNDLRYLQALMSKCPNKTFFMGGCLANRFDIPLPPEVRRLDRLCRDYVWLDDTGIIAYASPFWDMEFSSDEDPLRESRFMRDMYPLRIGVGCNKNCTYCTIRHTRGESYNLVDYVALEKEFLAHENVLLVNDSINLSQISLWCDLAQKHGKGIAFRNVEPWVALAAWNDLRAASKSGVLSALKVAVQSNNPDVLRDMQRPVASTLALIDIVGELRKYGTVLGTNIITEYKDFPDPEGLEEIFDVVVWNTYWDGVFDMERAKQKAERLFPWWHDG